MAVLRKKEDLVCTFKKWIFRRKGPAALVGALMVAFGAPAGGLTFSAIAGQTSSGLAYSLASLCVSVLALPVLGIAWLKIVEMCTLSGVRMTENAGDASCPTDHGGGSGGSCNGSGGSNCSGGTTRGFTKIESMLTSVIACALAEDCHANADLVINCRKLAPVNGRAQLDGCGCVKPCKDCKCRRELGEHSTQSEGTADADSQLKRADNESGSILDILGRLSEARFVTESIDSFIAKLAKIAFPNANCPALSLAFCGGGAYGRGGGVYGRGGPFGHKIQDDGGSFGCSGGGAYGRGGPFGRGGGVYG